jgi:hypothetical protein
MMVAFRDSRGALPKYAAKKGACHPNIPDQKRHKNETVCSQDRFDDIARMSFYSSSSKIYLNLFSYEGWGSESEGGAGAVYEKTPGFLPRQYLPFHH